MEAAQPPGPWDSPNLAPSSSIGASTSADRTDRHLPAVAFAGSLPMMSDRGHVSRSTQARTLGRHRRTRRHTHPLRRPDGCGTDHCASPSWWRRSRSTHRAALSRPACRGARWRVDCTLLNTSPGSTTRPRMLTRRVRDGTHDGARARRSCLRQAGVQMQASSACMSGHSWRIDGTSMPVESVVGADALSMARAAPCWAACGLRP